MLMGRLFQSRGAAIMKDRSPMVAFVTRFAVLKRIPLLFIKNKGGGEGRGDLKEGLKESESLITFFP